MIVRYQDAAGNAYLELAYTYTPDGLVQSIAETDEVSPVLSDGTMPIPPISSAVNFEYDNRNRLTREWRTATGTVDLALGGSTYDLSYTYDAGGNRLTKTDNLTNRMTTYHYDITDFNDGGQNNNRLLSYDVTDSLVQGSTEPGFGSPVFEQAIYTYGPSGNVTRLIKRFDSDGDGVVTDGDILADVWWFYYDTGNHLWLAVRGIGDYDAVAGTLVLGSTVFTTAAEYHYDGGRQRTLVRQRNPNPDDPNNPNSPRWSVIGTGQWRDYLGDGVYNDYTVDMNTGTVTNGTAYMPGIGFDDPSLAETPAYLGSDLIGTTRRIVGSATPTSPVLHRNVYTSFGELISSAGSENTRYGYAGLWGYEATEASFDPLAELGWLHVGDRYYDPSVGRFMQRDPIGIKGGLNVYEYATSNPLFFVDPQGRSLLGGIIGGIAGAVVGAITGGPTGAIVGGIGGLIAGARSDSNAHAAGNGALAGLGGGVGALVGRGVFTIAEGVVIGAAIGSVGAQVNGGNIVIGGLGGGLGSFAGVGIGNLGPEGLQELITSCVFTGTADFVIEAGQAGADSYTKTPPIGDWPR